MATNPRSATARRGAAVKATRRSPAAKARGRIAMLVATRKGAWIYHGDPRAEDLARRRPALPRSRRFTTWCSIRATAARCSPRRRPATSGPRVFRSTDLGKTWKEAKQPPAFAKTADGESGRSVDHTFWLTPGHASEPDVWYAGTSPQGLFRSDDGGVTWEPFASRSTTIRSTVEWMGTRAGRHARRPEDALDHRRSARSEAPLLRHVRRRRPRIDRRWPDVPGPDRRAWRWSKASTPRRAHLPRSRTASGSVRATRTGCTSRTTAASTGSTGRRTRGCGSARRCRRRSATSVSRWSCIRATPDTAWVLPDGRHRRCGRAPARRRQAGGLRHAQRRQDAGSDWTEGLPQAQALVDGEASGDDARTARDPRRAVLRHHQRRTLDEPRRRGDAGRAIARHLPEIYAVEAAVLA